MLLLPLLNLQHCQLLPCTTQFSRCSKSASPLICLTAVPGMQAPAAGPEGEGGLPACRDLPQKRSVRRHVCSRWQLAFQFYSCVLLLHHRPYLARFISLSITHMGPSCASRNEILMRSVLDTQPAFRKLCKGGHRQDRIMDVASLSDIEESSRLSQRRFSVLRQATRKVRLRMCFQ